MRIVWADLLFPPINLWSYPMTSTLYMRWSDMYCSEELERFYMYGSITDLQDLKKCQKEFRKIYNVRKDYWESRNES